MTSSQAKTLSRSNYIMCMIVGIEVSGSSVFNTYKICQIFFMY